MLAIGLGVDSSCVSASNGLIFKPSKIQVFKVAIVFAVMQGIMVAIGFVLVGFIPSTFMQFNHIIAFFLLVFVGTKMLIHALKPNQDPEEPQLNRARKISVQIVFVQAVSTSLDALIVGFAFGNQSIQFVLLSVAITALVTLVMCILAMVLGRKVSTGLTHGAEVLGAIILILIGVKLLLGGI